MNLIIAFGIGVLVFVLIVLMTAYFLKSASIVFSGNNRNDVIEMQEDEEDTDDLLDDLKDQVMPETVSEKS